MTKELFLTDSYLTQRNVHVINIEADRIELDETIFYPTGGGQEHDTGTLKQADRLYNIHKVKKENGKIVHYIEQPEGLTVGPAKITIDWDRRYEFMRHHSMLHIVGAVFHRKYNSLCTGNQIYLDKARIDLTEISSLSEEEIASAIQEANEEAQSNYTISSRILPRESVVNLSESVKTIVNLIPNSVQEIRFVSIGDIDEQPCGGTHVRQTSEVGKIILEKTKRKGKGITRLELKIN
ncbi:alanyl-tRNA synthetase domain protein [Bacillus sp. OxB-1]|uniref:alanyl-tRNA editing protein n=1 Tax=Bacillus sp. (strain OxB-1) TaxID=98228 RepID=UPI000582222F|nr:alanyl-tRNA editing protein [Bacillus sp. OxB-1]BAQ09974.1 alanyl-tRNA synthetase domain protein [Bacillus sp. OxB-1]